MKSSFLILWPVPYKWLKLEICRSMYIYIEFVLKFKFAKFDDVITFYRNIIRPKKLISVMMSSLEWFFSWLLIISYLHYMYYILFEMGTIIRMCFVVYELQNFEICLRFCVQKCWHPQRFGHKIFFGNSQRVPMIS